MAKPIGNLEGVAKLLLEGQTITGVALEGKALTLILGSNRSVEVTVQGNFKDFQGTHMASQLKELLDTQQPAADDVTRFAWMEELGDFFIDLPWLEFQIWRQSAGVTNEVIDTVLTGVGTDARKQAAQHFLDVTVAGHPFSASDSRVRQLILDAELPAPMQASLQALVTVQAKRWVRENISGPHSFGAVEKARTI